MCRAVSRVVFICLVLALIGSAAFGQGAQLSGQITDPAKAVVVKADVRVVNQATSVERKTQTNLDGFYAIPFLEPGLYKIFVQAPGFSTAVSEQLAITVNQVLILNFELKVGEAAEHITVSADSQLLDTTDAAVSTVVDRQFVENLPLNGRSFQSLLYLAPGVTPNVSSANTDLAQGQFVVNGQRGDANYWMVDGVSANIGLSSFQPGASIAGTVGGANALGGTSALVSVDALQEFRVETSSYAPEYGRGVGGQISIKTRSGTNQFHGALFDYLRNGALDATDWFANRNGLSKPLEIQNDFGGVLGGPIHKDKTFFFFSAEALRVHLPETFQGTVPDLSSRASAVSSVQPYVNAYPVPNGPEVLDGSGNPTGIAMYNATFSNRGSADAYSLRLDHQLHKSLSVFARYNHAPSSIAQHGADANTGTSILTTTSTTKTATVGATWVPSTNANMVDDFRFNYSVSSGKSVFSEVSAGGSAAFPSDNLFESGNGFTYQNSKLYFLALFGTNMRMDVGPQVRDVQHQWNVVDTLALQRGPHTFKFGVDYRRLAPTLNPSGSEELASIFTNVNSLVRGTSAFTYLEYFPPSQILLQNLSAFAQDTWRINSRLNLTYGVRWDVDYSPGTLMGPSLSLAAITGYSPTDFSNLALNPKGGALYSTKFGNFAPRIGGAYRIGSSPKWGLVFRGGFGVFYGVSSSEIYNTLFAGGDYPTISFTTLSNAPFPTPTGLRNTIPPIEAPTIENQGGLGVVDPNLNVPYALEWNVALEQSLGQAQTLSVSYVGASDKRLVATEAINNPNPNYVYAQIIANAGYSNYQSLQARFQRRLTNGLQALFSYTWSHSIDTGSYGAYANGTLADIKTNRGDSDYDVRNTFSGAITYNIPAASRNLVTRAITGGWSTDNILQLHSAPPMDVFDGAFSALFQQNANVEIRPDVVPGEPIYLYGSRYPGGKALNPAAFAHPPVDSSTGLPTRQGNLARNAVRALPFAQWDFAVRREFPIHDTLRLQFRAELFNILNHPNFGPFDNNFGVNDPFFGQPTQMLNQFLGGIAGNGTQNPLYTPGSSRSGELALKLIF